MDVDRSAPVVASALVEIAAPPDVVFEVIADLERWPAWNPDVKTMTTDGAVAEGTTFRWKAGPGTITSVVRHFERPKQIGWTGKTLGIDAVHVWQFEGDDEKTLATTTESWAGWLPRLLPGPMRKQLQKALDAGLPRLEAEAERRAAAG